MAHSLAYRSIPDNDHEAITNLRRHSTKWYYFCYHIIAFVAMALCSFFSFRLGQKYDSAEQCGQKLSTWSPAIDALEYHQTMFTGDFLAASPWRGVPSKQLDEAWDNITLAGLYDIRIEMSHLERLNKTRPVNPPYKFEDGKDGMIVLLEVFHHLHCLVSLLSGTLSVTVAATIHATPLTTYENALRKLTWPGYYPKIEPEVENLVRAHTDHCIEMLRIALMCTADVTPVVMYVPEWQDDPIPDFDTLHICRNFNKIVDFVEQNRIEWTRR